MPIPFTDFEELDGLGSAAFLKLQLQLELERSVAGACWLGALLVISARGEPLEFGYNRVRVPEPFLWREADLRRYTERRLTTSLLSVCSQQPRLLLCMADEVSTGLFGQDLQLEVPVIRVGESLTSHRRVDTQTGEVLGEEDPWPHVVWQPAPPAEDSMERRLFAHLAAHGLLLEPFERATAGLSEVYRPSPCLSQR
jgi:hypothetical protein